MRRRLSALATSLWIVLAVAIATRLIFAFSQIQTIPQPILSSAPFLYEPGNVAYSIATGRGFGSPFRADTGPTAWEPPVYPLLVAGIFKIFGTYTFPSFLATFLLNVLFSTLTCVPIFFIGKRIGGLSVAAGSAWLWAIFPNGIIIPFEWMWDTSLSALLVATILWGTLVVADSRRLRDWCGYGLLWGFSLMTNASLLSLLPLLLCWMIYRAYQQGRPWITKSALAVAIVVLGCIPWTIRNYVVFHTFVPLRTGLGLQLWLGNNNEYHDRFPGWLHPIDNTHERNEYVRMGEIAYMRNKQKDAIEWMLANPTRVLELSLRRFIGIWTGSLTPLNDFLKVRSFLVRSVLILNLLAAIGALFGIVRLFRKGREYVFPIAVFPIVFPLPFYLTQALLRYRHPIDPVMMLLCAVALQGAFYRSERGRRPRT